MHFLKLTTLAALAITGQAQVSSDTFMNNINAITDLSAQTTDVARSISFTNIFNTGPQLINNFRQIIGMASADVASGSFKKRDTQFVGGGAVRELQPRQAAPPYTETNQLEICDAFREFVMVHQELLNVVIGKNGILSATPFTAPLGQVLRVLEGSVDTLAFGVIDVVPTCAQETTNEKNSLDETLATATNTYS